MNRLTVAVSGATGYLGGFISRKLERSGITVEKFSSSSDLRKNQLHPSMGLEELTNELKERRVDTLINCANYFSLSSGFIETQRALGANLEFPIRLFESGASAGVTTFIHFPTYWQNRVFAPSNDSYSSVYNATKRAFSDFLETRGNVYANCVELYLPEVFGPFDPRMKLIPGIIRSEIANKPIELRDPDRLLMLSSVENLAEFILGGVEGRITLPKKSMYVDYPFLTPMEIHSHLSRILRQEKIEGIDLGNISRHSQENIITQYHGVEYVKYKDGFSLEEALFRTAKSFREL